jgi:hypothetical protein
MGIYIYIAYIKNKTIMPCTLCLGPVKHARICPHCLPEVCISAYCNRRKYICHQCGPMLNRGHCEKHGGSMDCDPDLHSICIQSSERRCLSCHSRVYMDLVLTCTNLPVRTVVFTYLVGDEYLLPCLRILRKRILTPHWIHTLIEEVEVLTLV